MPAKTIIPAQNFHLNEERFQAKDQVGLKAEGLRLKAFLFVEAFLNFIASFPKYLFLKN